jgi:hypothetical protein
VRHNKSATSTSQELVRNGSSCLGRPGIRVLLIAFAAGSAACLIGSSESGSASGQNATAVRGSLAVVHEGGFIYRRFPNGRLTQLTSGRAPAWSRNGSRIAFVRPRDFEGLQGPPSASCS